MTDQAITDRIGESSSRISTQVVALFKEYTGRGPTRCRTTIRENLVVCLLEDTLTKAERRLVEDGKVENVRALRRAIQDTMDADLRAVVEQATGRRVIAFMSSNHIDPDFMAEVFVLDAPAEAPSEGVALHAVPAGDELS